MSSDSQILQRRRPRIFDSAGYEDLPWIATLRDHRWPPVGGWYEWHCPELIIPSGGQPEWARVDGVRDECRLRGPTVAFEAM